MLLECPNCNEKIVLNADTFLNQKHVTCAKCLLIIQLRDLDGTLKHLKFTFEEEKLRKEESG